MTREYNRKDDATRKAVLNLLRSGRATVGELATMLKTSHQRVDYWRATAGINAQKAREKFLDRAWAKSIPAAHQSSGNRAGRAKNGRVITEA